MGKSTNPTASTAADLHLEQIEAGEVSTALALSRYAAAEDPGTVTGATLAPTGISTALALSRYTTAEDPGTATGATLPTGTTLAPTSTGTSVEDLQGLADELTLETAISIDTEKVGPGNAWVKCGAVAHTFASLVQTDYICNTNLHMTAPKTRGRTPRRAPATPTKGARDKSSPPRFPIDQLEYVIQNIKEIKGILPGPGKRW